MRQKNFLMSFQEELLRDLQTISRGKAIAKAEFQLLIKQDKDRMKRESLARRDKAFRARQISPWKPNGPSKATHENVYNTFIPESKAILTNPNVDENSNHWNIQQPESELFIKTDHFDFSSFPRLADKSVTQSWLPPTNSLNFFSEEEYNQLGPSSLPQHATEVITVPSRTLDGTRPNFMCGLSRHWKRQKRSKLPHDPTAYLIDAFYRSKFLRAHN